MLKLNLGCGQDHRDGYINIDSSEYCNPDMLVNLENLPLPFKANSCDETLMKSVLEHMPSNPNIFFGFLQEVYRISAPNASIYIECPHPNHRWQVVDFTHQKAIHFEGLQMLSKEFCEKLVAKKSTKTPLALIYNIDFQMTEYSCSFDYRSQKHIENILGKFESEKIESYCYLFNNVAATQSIRLRVIK